MATISLVPLAGDASLPERVDITVTSPPVGAAFISVYSIADVQSAVRNANRAPVSGGFFVTDFQVPLGVPVTYRAEYFDAAGTSLGLSGDAVTQVDSDPQFIVIQDPLAPKRFVKVDAPPSFASDVGRRRAVSVYNAGGRTVALMGELGLRSDVPINVSTRTIAQADMLEDVLAEAPFLIRTMPNIVRLPPLFYGVTAGAVQTPVDVDTGGSWIRWELSAQEVSPLLLDIIEAVVTYARFKAAFATYAAAKAVYTTYLQAKQSPPPEV